MEAHPGEGEARAGRDQRPLAGAEGFPREAGGGWWLPFPSPWDLSNPGIEPRAPALQVDSFFFFFHFFLLVGGELLYNIVVVFVIH